MPPQLGRDAVVLFAANQEDAAVVLTDIMMPIMDGKTTTPCLSLSLAPNIQKGPVAMRVLSALREGLMGRVL